MTWIITWIIDCGDGVYIERGRPSTTLQTTPHRTMTNAELTLDQLQAVAGGATAIEYGLIATLLPKDQLSLECKVPPSFKKPQDSLVAVVIIA